MDLSLDDIIKLKKQNTPNNQASSNNKNNNLTQNKLGLERLKELGARSGIFNKKTTILEKLKTSQDNSKSLKLIISNLHTQITNIRDLFEEIGPLKKATIFKDCNDKSIGVAEVIYQDDQHAHKAMKTYHLRAIDGQPIHISIVPCESSNGPRPLLDRLGIKKGNEVHKKPQKKIFSGKSKKKKNNKKRNKQEDLTIEDLDADIEAYRQSRIRQ